MKWVSLVSKKAKKKLRQAGKYKARLAREIKAIEIDPLLGAVPIRGKENTYRRRVGGWRVIFEIQTVEGFILIRKIEVVPENRTGS